jgi:hypothetical protein
MKPFKTPAGAITSMTYPCILPILAVFRGILPLFSEVSFRRALPQRAQKGILAYNTVLCILPQNSRLVKRAKGSFFKKTVKKEEKYQKSPKKTKRRHEKRSFSFWRTAFVLLAALMQPS